jgi:transglutaminase-like putative cysteine protease
MNKTLALAAFAALAGSAFAQVDLQMDKVTIMRAVGSSHVAGTPFVGESVVVKVDWAVAGYEDPNPYVVRVKMGGQTKEAQIGSVGGYLNSVYFVFRGGFDTNVTAVATLDPDNESGEAGYTRADNQKSVSFTPVPIDKTIEYFSPVTWQGEIRQTMTLSSVQSGATVEVVAPRPTSDSFQRVNSTIGLFQRSVDPVPYALTQKTGDATGHPLYHNVINAKAGMFTAYTSANITASNVRINRAKMTATWSQVDSLKNVAIFNTYTLPQASAQSTSATIQNYVVSTLGSNYRSTMTPIEAARRLFQRVVRDITYYAEPDKPWDAVSVLQQRRGDCAGYALLYQACMRAIGIPTRMVAGCWATEEFSAHCWSEFWMPGAGWVPADACGSRGADPTGNTLYQFGIFTNLNSRIALSRGVELKAGSLSWVVLQGPWLRFSKTSSSPVVCTATWSRV